MKTPLSCRFGFHSWFLDSAFLHSAYKCNRCLRWRDPAKGAQVDMVREVARDSRDFQEIARKLAERKHGSES